MTTTTIAPRVCDACAKRPDSFEEVKLDGRTFRVCSDCLAQAEGPGRYDEIHEDDLPLAVALYAVALQGGGDWSLSDEWGSGSATKFGRVILVQDERGQLDLREFADAAAAEREMNSWEDDGMGASQDDAWISYTNRGIEVSFAGKHIGTFDRLTRAQACVSLAMRKEGYFPNVWVSGEHGPTVRRIDVW
jgi:hypothetical protein